MAGTAPCSPSPLLPHSLLPQREFGFFTLSHFDPKELFCFLVLSSLGKFFDPDSPCFLMPEVEMRTSMLQSYYEDYKRKLSTGLGPARGQLSGRITYRYYTHYYPL